MTMKVTLLKISRLLPTAKKNMHMKFEIEIPKQTWVMILMSFPNAEWALL